MMFTAVVHFTGGWEVVKECIYSILTWLNKRNKDRGAGPTFSPLD